MNAGDRIAGVAGSIVRLALAPFRLVTDRVAMRFAGPLAELKPGEGRVVDVEGTKVAAYRDPDGVVHAVSPICTHLRCVVAFDAEQTGWRCPCHGSRFTVDGKVLRGPAKQPLEPRSVDAA